jgi:Holliday junction resolvasome RuvABC endonuclease subunit
MGWALLQAAEMAGNVVVASNANDAGNTGITSGSVSFATNKRANWGVRFLNFQRWLVGMLSGTTTANKHPVDMVVFEDVRNHAGVFAAHVYGGFVAQLAAVCEELKIPYQGFGVKPIKKFITGSGNASKQDVINAVQTRGYRPMAENRPLDDNEADAIALLLLAENALAKNIFIEESKDMNSDNITRNTNGYSVSLGSRDGEVEICNAKNNASGLKIQMGPYEYSQVTGKYAAGSR